MAFEPQWEGVFIKWTYSYMKVHMWKIRQPSFDLEDAVAEGRRIFVWCLRKTTSRGGRIDNEKWFMRYYQRAVATWIIDRAAKATAERDAILIFAQQQRSSVQEPEGPLLTALAQDASPELQTVLRTIMATPGEFFLRLTLHPGPDNIWSRRLCRLCGIPVNENIIGELRKLLKSDIGSC